MHRGNTEQLSKWADRLDAFTFALDAIDADDPFRFCEDAWEIWQSAAAADPPPMTSPAVLVVLEGLRALAHAMTVATLDYYRTPDVTDRMTVATVRTALGANLDGIRGDCERWLGHEAPAADEIRARCMSILSGMQAANESGDELRAEHAPAGAPARGSLDTGFVYDKVCALSEADNKRYREAYDRLRRMLDRELLQHICDGADALTDVLAAIVHELEADRMLQSDEDAMDECKRRIRSAVLSVTSALRIHREQTTAAAARTFGVDSAEANTVRRLFNDLTRSSCDYGWLEELRDALQHGDIDAVTYHFPARLDGRARADVFLNVEHLSRLGPRAGRISARSELAGATADTSIVTMLTATLPKVKAVQELLDPLLFPDVAEDVSVVKEFICRFGGGDGMRALHSAAGFTGGRLTPPRLSPRVLAFVQGFQARGHSA
ncbi:hypothetical protein B1R94_08585 [Mycolicibacterium litorale]|nr:hypothetical protein B1R94_08585 [Mycolicibacterium litorale]